MRALAFAVLFVALLGERSAHALSGFYVSARDAKLVANASQVVVMREGTRTVISMQNDYEGPPESFAMVVPVPVAVQKENVRTLPREVFEHLEKLDAPRLVEYWERDPCARVDPSKRVEGAAPSASAPPPPSPSASSDGVAVDARFAVGEYEIVVLGAKDGAGLEAWLHREGYKIPPGSETFLRPYVSSGSKFIVAKVDIAKVKMEGGKATLSPLRFHYDAPELRLPIRLGVVSSGGTQDLIVHVLGKGRRYEVANYPSVTIPTNLDVAENVKGRFVAFYAALFDRAIAKNPKAVVTEYAWDAASCEPCASPPLTDAELVALGADVLPSVSSETQTMDRGLMKALGAGPLPRRTYYGLRSSFVLTRLHARYTREAAGDDLVFREAPPLTGGRELRSGEAAQLETTATVPADGHGTNAFQGRYAIRHPWAGPIACADPVRDVWGGPPNGIDNGGPRPAFGLAYAPRDNVQLASFLRSDVDALDVKAEGARPSGVGTFSAPPAPPPSSAEASSRDAGAPPGAKKRGCSGCTTTPASSSFEEGAWLVALCGLGLVASRVARRAR